MEIRAKDEVVGEMLFEDGPEPQSYDLATLEGAIYKLYLKTSVQN
jgi:hypothetical protein